MADVYTPSYYTDPIGLVIEVYLERRLSPDEACELLSALAKNIGRGAPPPVDEIVGNLVGQIVELGDEPDIDSLDLIVRATLGRLQSSV